MKETQGNLLQLAQSGKFKIIVHGLNCFHDMSGGIASQISNLWPEVLEDDKTTPYGDETKLGTIRLVCSESNKNPGQKTELWVFNAYTQYKPGPNPNQNAQIQSYEAIKNCFQQISRLIIPTAPIGIPQIGAGIAGGDWKIISKIIEDAIPNHDLTVVNYVP